MDGPRVQFYVRKRNVNDYMKSGSLTQCAPTVYELRVGTTIRRS